MQKPNRFLFLYILMLLTATQPAMASLLIAPQRVIFDGTTRETQLILINKGAQTATYRLSYINNHISRNGTYETITTATTKTKEKFSDSMVKFSPRQITIRPGEQQVVRLLLRKPSKLAVGEYRSHLRFGELPPPSAPQPTTVAKGLAMDLKINYGITIPILVRQGSTSAIAKLSGAKFELTKDAKQTGTLKLTISRDGNQSVFGNLTVKFKPAKTLDEFQVGASNAVAVYTPYPERDISIPVRFPDGKAIGPGIFTIEYRDAEERSNSLLATVVLTYP